MNIVFDDEIKTTTLSSKLQLDVYNLSGLYLNIGNIVTNLSVVDIGSIVYSNNSNNNNNTLFNTTLYTISGNLSEDTDFVTKYATKYTNYQYTVRADVFYWKKLHSTMVILGMFIIIPVSIALLLGLKHGCSAWHKSMDDYYRKSKPCHLVAQKPSLFTKYVAPILFPIPLELLNRKRRYSGNQSTV